MFEALRHVESDIDDGPFHAVTRFTYREDNIRWYGEFEVFTSWNGKSGHVQLDVCDLSTVKTTPLMVTATRY